MNELQFTKLTKLESKYFIKDSLMMFIREELFSIIDKDQLPCQYDGSCCCKMDSILFDERGSVIYILLVNNWQVDHEKDGVLLIPQGEIAEVWSCMEYE